MTLEKLTELEPGKISEEYDIGEIRREGHSIQIKVTYVKKFNRSYGKASAEYLKLEASSMPPIYADVINNSKILPVHWRNAVKATKEDGSVDKRCIVTGLSYPEGGQDCKSYDLVQWDTDILQQMCRLPPHVRSVIGLDKYLGNKKK